MSSNSLTLGLSDGLRYAAAHPDDRRRLGRIVRARTAVEVTEIVAEDAVEALSVADPVAYWSGFAHGVRRFLQDTAGAPSS